MAILSVWAPAAHQLEVVIDDRIYALHQAKRGWWVLDTPLIRHGTDYAYLVNGEGPFPDPRSAWQPEGVHGQSRWVDHNRFSWTDSRWQQPPLSSAVIYELHVGTFTPEGTFDSAIEGLDHLLELGISHVELMPVAEFQGIRGWGYDGVDIFAPHHAYGEPESLKRFVNACHLRGLSVILDVVYNHLGPSGNYLSKFGPYFTEKYKTPWGQAVNFDDRRCDEVRQFFLDNALMWLRDYHIDGLRIDAVHAIYDRSAIHFLEELATKVRRLEAELGRYLILIAESDLNDPRIIRCPDLGGYGIDAQWNEDFHHALHAFLTGENQGYYRDFGTLSDLAKALTRGQVYDGCYSIHRERNHGRSLDQILAHQLVVCLQNHDQVGNRALGDRTSRLLTQGQLKIGAALVLLSPYTPMLFQGEEWAAETPFLYFTDHREAGLAEAVKSGRQKEFESFGWPEDKIPDPQAETTFQHSKLDWSEMNQWKHLEIFNWHQALIKMRHRYPALKESNMGRTEVAFDETAGWLIMKREDVLLVCNFNEKGQLIPWVGLNDKEVILSSEEGGKIEGSSLCVPKHSAVILATKKIQ